jgi:hypothetical protein
MKRIGLCVVGAVLLIALTASVAYANTTSAYAGWTDPLVVAAQNGIATPHKGFTTTTIKCAVCHAVHKGDAGGEALLPGTMITACEYCHISNFIGNIKIYAGNPTNYSSVADLNTAHSGNYNASCTACHSVHGGNTITTPGIASVTAKILRNNAGSGLQGTDVALTHQQVLPNATPVTSWTDFANTSNRDGVISAFCTQCHPYFQGAYNGEIQLADTNVYQSHVMKANTNAYGNTSAAAAVAGDKVADADSTYCRSCHMAGEANVSGTLPVNTYQSNSNFPHYTPNRPRFLVSAAYSGAAPEDFTVSRIDGVCLNCHRWDAGSGVITGAGTSNTGGF